MHDCRRKKLTRRTEQQFQGLPTQPHVYKQRAIVSTCGCGTAATIRRMPLRIHRILERFPRRKFDGLCSRNLDRFTGPRVATGARRTLAGAEGAKADQLNTVAFGDGSRHNGDKRVNGLAGGGLACANGQCDSVNQFLLVHIHPLGVYLAPRRRGAWRTRHDTGGVGPRQPALAALRLSTSAITGSSQNSEKIVR